MQHVLRSLRHNDEAQHAAFRMATRALTSQSLDAVDVTIVGGGIVGLATARELLNRHPDAKVAILEKEAHVAPHQTSHNSGVIHAGIYYKPGSTIARLCVQGLKLMYEYCDEKGVKYDRCGKLVVATSDADLPVLDTLYERSLQNGAPEIEMVDSKTISEMEPNVRALRAIHSPWTGIINYADVAESLAKDVNETGRGRVHCGFVVKHIDRPSNRIVAHATDGRSIESRYLITCAGLQADRVSRMAGGAKSPIVLPFRGSYQEVLPEYRTLVRRNIYPVPASYSSLRFPAIGVHITPKMDGKLLLGPNAALAFAREGYRFWDINVRDLLESATTPALWRLVLGNFGMAMQEIWRDVNTRAFVAEVQKYCPGLKLEHTRRASGVTGVHAIAINTDGTLVTDFAFESINGNVLNVRNAPSPAATSSLAIAKDVMDRAQADWKW